MAISNSYVKLPEGNYSMNASLWMAEGFKLHKTPAVNIMQRIIAMGAWETSVGETSSVNPGLVEPPTSYSPGNHQSSVCNLLDPLGKEAHLSPVSLKNFKDRKTWHQYCTSDQKPRGFQAALKSIPVKMNQGCLPQPCPHGAPARLAPGWPFMWPGRARDELRRLFLRRRFSWADFTNKDGDLTNKQYQTVVFNQELLPVFTKNWFFIKYQTVFHFHKQYQTWF